MNTNNLVRAWIYQNFDKTYTGGFYLLEKAEICSIQNSFEKVKEELSQKAKEQDLIISMVIEFVSFKEVLKNKEG